MLDEKKTIGEHSRRYNLGLSEIPVLMSDETAERRSVSVLLKVGGIREMSDTHRSTDPLHFVILFPTGADDRHLGLKQKRGEKNPSPPQFYSFQIQYRLNNPNVPLRGCWKSPFTLCMLRLKMQMAAASVSDDNQCKILLVKSVID